MSIIIIHPFRPKAFCIPQPDAKADRTPSAPAKARDIDLDPLVTTGRIDQVMRSPDDRSLGLQTSLQYVIKAEAGNPFCEDLMDGSAPGQGLSSHDPRCAIIRVEKATIRADE